MRKLTRIKLIYTGGTIGGEATSGTLLDNNLKPKNFFKDFLDELEVRIPGIMSQVKIEDSDISTPVKDFSENFTPEDWLRIAIDIKSSLEKEKYEGVIIIHGTDTMAYTAAALTFLIKGAKIPIILTGSILPITDKDTDAFKNMSDAIYLILNKRDYLKGIFLSFSGQTKGKSYVHLGNRCRKVMVGREAYESINVRPIAEVSDWIWGKKIRILNRELLEQVIKINEKEKFDIYDKICSNVAVFRLYPGFNPEFALYVIRQFNVRGIIFEAYVSGTGIVKSGKYSLIPLLEQLKRRKVPAFFVSQQKGLIRMNQYKSSKELLRAGAFSLEDMITEAAYAKLCWLLENFDSYEDIIRKMRNNISGEITT